MDGVAINKPTVVSPIKNDSLSNYGTFNRSVSAHDAKPTGQLRQPLPDWIAEASKRCESYARNDVSLCYQRGLGSGLVFLIDIPIKRLSQKA